MVTDNRLFITNLSQGMAHNAGVFSMSAQAIAWNTQAFFNLESDANATYDRNSNAPDLVISASRRYSSLDNRDRRLGK